MLATSSNGASVLTETLVAAGVRTIFSLSGNQIMPVYDACIDSGIRIVHVRHEAAAVAMADAHAQLTGEIGVALVTAAPGFANALSPLYSARAAESPVLLLSGDAPVEQDGCGAFQELDQTAIATPLVKASMRPIRGRDLSVMTAEAIRLALSGRKGPVHMALPFDVLQARGCGEPVDDRKSFEPVKLAMAEDDAIEIGRLIDAADRPLVLVGPQMNATRDGGLCGRLSDALDLPVIAMESPRGLRDPSLGAVAEIVGSADLIVLVGKAVDFTLGFLRSNVLSPSAGIIVIDPDHHLIDRARALCGRTLLYAARADVDVALEALKTVEIEPKPPGWRKEAREAVAFRKRPTANGAAIHPVAVCDAVSSAIKTTQEAILVCDGGEFGQWAQAFCDAPCRIINGPSGAIGNGINYAIAAKMARPEATVILLMGDGTAGFHLAEFETAAREDAAIVAVVGNDSCWNAEHQIQLRDYGPDRLVGCGLSQKARYDQAAAALGCHGAFVDRQDDLGEAIAGAIASGRPALVNVVIEGAPAPTFSRSGQKAPASH